MRCHEEALEVLLSFYQMGCDAPLAVDEQQALLMAIIRDLIPLCRSQEDLKHNKHCITVKLDVSRYPGSIPDRLLESAQSTANNEVTLCLMVGPDATVGDVKAHITDFLVEAGDSLHRSSVSVNIETVTCHPLSMSQCVLECMTPPVMLRATYTRDLQRSLSSVMSTLSQGSISAPPAASITSAEQKEREARAHNDPSQGNGVWAALQMGKVYSQPEPRRKGYGAM